MTRKKSEKKSRVILLVLYNEPFSIYYLKAG